jgi:hypothetical protein
MVKAYQPLNPNGPFFVIRRKVRWRLFISKAALNVLSRITHDIGHQCLEDDVLNSGNAEENRRRKQHVRSLIA